MKQASAVTLHKLAGRCGAGSEQDDQQLVQAARGGDDWAFEQLYARYRPRLHAFAVRMIHDPDRADDLVQEVFISALRRLRDSDARIIFRPWIYEIARNACIDEYRRSRRVSEVPLEREGVEGWLDHLSGGPSPEVVVESRQRLEDLRHAFRGLSDRHHRIIVARELEGKSYREIGAELDMSQAVVESTLFRARRRLGEEFHELSSGRRCARVQTIIGSAQGRRLGIRERRAVLTHVEHCRPCRRDALSAGFSLRAPKRRRLRNLAAGLAPVPLLRLLRLAPRASSTPPRALAFLSSAARLGQAPGALGVVRIAAVAAAVATGIGGGLLSQVRPARAHAALPEHAAGGFGLPGLTRASVPAFRVVRQAHPTAGAHRIRPAALTPGASTNGAPSPPPSGVPVRHVPQTAPARLLGAAATAVPDHALSSVVPPAAGPAIAQLNAAVTTVLTGPVDKPHRAILPTAGHPLLTKAIHSSEAPPRGAGHALGQAIRSGSVPSPVG